MNRGHKAENTIRKGKTCDVLSIQRENGNVTKILGKSDIISKKRKKEETRVAVGIERTAVASM